MMKLLMAFLHSLRDFSRMSIVGSLDGRKQLHTTDCGALALAMTMEKKATKEIIFDSFTTID